MQCISGNASGSIQMLDIRIRQGKIIQASPHLTEEDQESVLSTAPGESWYASPAFMDLFSVITDPGFEWKETHQQWAEQAGAGGFSDALVIPETSPVPDRGEVVRALLSRNSGLKSTMWIAGALTAGKNGKQLAELQDMYTAGVRIFTDGLKPSLPSARKRTGLEYLKGFSGKMMVFPQDAGLSENGQIHEGKSALFTGLHGIPSLAESLMVYRDSELALLTGTHIHFCGISCLESVDILRAAKQKGAPVSASVFTPHLYYTESSTESFESVYKVLPPFRSEEDRLALIDAVAEGIIEGLASGHVPFSVEEKELEFPYASFGMRNLKSSFSIAWNMLVHSGKMSPAGMVQRFVEFPRKFTDVPVSEDFVTLWKTDSQGIALNTGVLENRSLHFSRS